MEESLLKALQESKKYRMKWEDNRQKQLYKEIVLPASLANLLPRLGKTDLDALRKAYDFKGISALKKQELEEALIKQLPSKINQSLRTLDQGRYGLIKQIYQQGGALPIDEIEISKVEFLMTHHFIFPGIVHNQKVLVLPTEMMKVLQNVDTLELEWVIKRNTEWILITHGLAYYYGAIGNGFTRMKNSELTGQEVDISEFISVIYLATKFYAQIRATMEGFCDSRILEGRKIIEEQRKRESLDFYPFTKKQLIKAGNECYYDSTPELEKFIHFLSEGYELTPNELDEISYQCVNLIQMDKPLADVIRFLQSIIEFPDQQFINKLMNYLVPMYNTTRMWALKGHTPDEITRNQKAPVNVLQRESEHFAGRGGNIVELKSRKKVGRNDPCPCGSGKKFKFCCKE